MNNTIRITLVLIAFWISNASIAQTYRCIVEVNDSWGYIDETGKLVIDAKYDKAHPFSNDGVAAVKKLGATQYEFINLSGERLKTEVTTFDFKGNRFIDGMLPVKINGKWGYMNSDGKIAIQPIYSSATVWNNGFGIVSKKKTYYVIDRSGSEKLIKHNSIIDVEPFSEGFASFKTSFGTEGFLDTEGNVAISPSYKTVGNFNGGLAWVKNVAGQVFYINKGGQKAFEGNFDVAKNFDPVSKMALVKEFGYWKYVSQRGGRIDVLVKIYGSFSDGLAYCKNDMGVGFINNYGSWAIQPTFRAVRDFKNGYAAASIDNLWGIIDESGAWVIRPKFTAIKDMERIDR